jgi:hypothetical protein
LRMSRTRALLCVHFPPDIADLIMSNFGDPTKHTWSDLWEYCIESRKPKIVFAHACRNGNIELVKFMIKRGIKNFNIGFVRASKYGHIDIVRLIVDIILQKLSEVKQKKCADVVANAIHHNNCIFKLAIECAIINLHINVVMLLVHCYPHGLNDALYKACCLEYIDVAKLMIEKGADDFCEGMYSAVCCGKLESIKLMFEHKANFYPVYYFSIACSNGHSNVMRFIQDMNIDGVCECTRTIKQHQI